MPLWRSFLTFVCSFSPKSDRKIRKKGIAKYCRPCYNALCVRPKQVTPILGCRQAVRHQTLTLTFVGSNPAIPAIFISYDPLAQPAEQLPFKQWVRSSNLRRITNKSHTTKVVWLLLLWTRRRFEDLKCNSPVDCCSCPARWA